jgi:hypothetical protein
MARFSLSVAASGGLAKNIFFETGFSSVSEFADALALQDVNTIFIGELVEFTETRGKEMRWPMAIRADLIESVILIQG